MVEHEETARVKQWLNSELGRYARSWEAAQMNHLLSNVFGYHAIQIGMPHWDLLRENRISHKWYTHSKIEATAAGGALVVCEAEQLPFASESIDLLVLPHVLETSSDPHQVLREVQRVLVPEGKVLISGFNPWSLWGARERMPGLERLLPVEPHQQLSPWRVADWLELLSFELNNEEFGCYSPLFLQKKWLDRWAMMDRWGPKWWPIIGAVYVLKATKRVNSITMVGLDWSKKTPARAQPSVATGRNMKNKQSIKK